MQEVYFNNHAIQKQIISITDLFTAQDSADILQYANEYKILTKTVSLQLGEERFTILFSAFASKIEEKSVREISVMISDITPIVKEKDAMIARLYTDALTGLPNRTKLFEDLTKYESLMTLFIIDIENFSNINHL